LPPKDQQIDAKELQRCLTSSGISGNYHREYGTDSSCGIPENIHTHLKKVNENSKGGQ